MHTLSWFKAAKDQNNIFLSFCVDFTVMLATNMWKANWKWQSDKIIETENCCCCYSFWDIKYHVLNNWNYLVFVVANPPPVHVCYSDLSAPNSVCGVCKCLTAFVFIWINLLCLNMLDVLFKLCLGLQHPNPLRCTC